MKTFYKPVQSYLNTFKNHELVTAFIMRAFQILPWDANKSLLSTVFMNNSIWGVLYTYSFLQEQTQDE